MPAQRIGQKATDKGADHAGQAKDTAKDPHVPWSLRGHKEISRDGKSGRRERCRTNALHHAEGNQLQHAHRNATERRAKQKDHDPPEQDDFAPVKIGKLAIDWHHRCAGQQIASRDPTDQVDGVKIGYNRRQCGGNNRLV